MALETKIWVLGVLVAVGVSVASRSTRMTEPGGLCVYWPTCMHKCVTISECDLLDLHSRHATSLGQIVSTWGVPAPLLLLYCNLLLEQ